MDGLYNTVTPVLNARTFGLTDAATVVTVAAKANEYWVLSKLWVGVDSSGATDFDALNSSVSIQITIGGTTRWSTYLHPGNGGTASLEFELGPWPFDFSPGLYTGVKNEILEITVAAFGSGSQSSVNILYQ